MNDLVINGGCRTVIAGGSHTGRDVTFSNGDGVYLIITPDGRLESGPALKLGDHKARKLAAMLVEEFGIAYHSRLRVEVDRANAAEARTRAAERKAVADIKALQESLRIVRAKLVAKAVKAAPSPPERKTRRKTAAPMPFPEP